MGQVFSQEANSPPASPTLAKKQLAEVEDRIKNGKIAPGGAVSEAELNAKAEAEAIMAKAAAEEKAKLESEAKTKAEAEEAAKLEAEAAAKLEAEAAAKAEAEAIFEPVITEVKAEE